MKLAVVYDPLDLNLRPDAHAYLYRGQLESILNRWQNTIIITEDCHADDIDADAILFFDIRSRHHINIENIKNHSAVKIEYFDDPQQKEKHGYSKKFKWRYHKLGIKQRVNRALNRGVEFIICSTKAGFYKYIAPELGEKAETMFIHIPATPAFKSCDIPLNERKISILGNGVTWDVDGLGCYDFRIWAHKQDEVTVVKHTLRDKTTPNGKHYDKLLKQYAGAIALNDYFPCAKYFEIPLAGCVTFAQYHEEYKELGFEDYKTCIYVDRNNFNERARAFLDNPEVFQPIADAGRKLVEENYTSKHFADIFYNAIKERING